MSHDRAVCDDIVVTKFLSGLASQREVHPHGLAGLLTLVEETSLPKPLHPVLAEVLVKRAPLSLAKAVDSFQMVLPVQFGTEPH